MRYTLNGNFVVCEKINRKNEIDGDSFVVFQETVDLYKIIDIHFKDYDGFPFSVGDTVACCATGTELEIDGKTLYLMNPDYIIGRII